MIKYNFRYMVFTLTLLALLISCKEEEVNNYTSRPYIPDTNTSTEFVIEHYMVSTIEFDVYIPPEYNGNQNLPILYFNDGDNFQHVFEELLEGYQEPFLMVGLYAGSNRTDKYVPYSDPYANSNPVVSMAYSKAIIDDILPFVESRFKVDESRRAIFGMSYGGLHATWMGLEYPDIFSFVGALSPSYWVDDYAIIRSPVSGVSSSSKFYFDMGTNEWNYYVPFISSLETAGLKYGEEIYYYEVFGGGHTGSDWAKRINIPFSLFINGGPSGESSYELFVECIPSISTPGLVFRRLNPVINFEDGIKYSLTTEATYEIVKGNGQVTIDGRFEVDDQSMTVRVSYEDWSEEVELIQCN